MTLVQLLVAFIATGIPILNGLLTRWNNVTGRVYLQIVLNAVNGFAIEWLHAITTSDDWNFNQALINTMISLLTAIVIQAGVWKPLGVSDAAKRSAVGADAAPPLRRAA